MVNKELPDDIAKAIIDYTASTGKFEGWKKTYDRDGYVDYKIIVNAAEILVKRRPEKKLRIPFTTYFVEFNNENYAGSGARRVFDAIHKTFGDYLVEQQKLEETNKSKTAEDAFREKVLGKR